MDTILWKDFSSGWTPSDDSVNGRDNGLLLMDSLELDRNGAIQLTRGTKNWYSFNYPADAHSIYSGFISGIRTHYLVLTNGHIYRNVTDLIGSASTTRAGFVKAYDYVWIFAGQTRIRDTGSSFVAVGLLNTNAPNPSLNGAGILIGDYQYARQDVYNSGSAYFAKSALVSNPAIVSANNNKISVSSAAGPSGIANEIWYFRRGGTLDNWYRIAVKPTNAAFDDNLSDFDAIDLGEIANINLAPTHNSPGGITEDILDAAGLINGRMILFTAKSIYFSLIGSPDTYDTRTTIGTASSAYNTGSEIFLWAKKVGENAILVGTTADVYLLTGSFEQLPDGRLDVVLRCLSVHNPPISIHADVYNSNIVYMSKSGWVMCDLNGNTTSLIFPNVDTLYRGNTVYGNKGIPIYIYPSINYSCCVAKEKLWCRVPQIESNDPSGGIGSFTYRLDIYDFLRKTWRTVQTAPLRLMKEEDDAVTGFFNDSGTRNLRLLDNPVFAGDDKTFKGPSGTKQTIKLLTTFNSGNNPLNRKDAYNLHFLIDTGGDNVALVLYKDGSTIGLSLGNISSSGLSEKYVNLSAVGTGKMFQLQMIGTVADFLMSFAALNYEPHPNPVLRVTSTGKYYGPFKSRPRVWPVVIDTLGNDVTFTPIVDGITQTSSVFTSVIKRTLFHHFTTDVFGTNFAYAMTSTGPFELYEVLEPEFVQRLPLAKRFDQIGPAELFRYGKIRRFEFRIIAFGGTIIPYRIFEEDVSIATGNITIADSKEGVAEVSLPKGIYGTVLRIELGPTSFDFHRIYTKAQVSITGKDSDLEWKILEQGQQQ